jgi:hypothetical protein
VQNCASAVIRAGCCADGYWASLYVRPTTNAATAARGAPAPSATNAATATGVAPAPSTVTPVESAPITNPTAVLYDAAKHKRALNVKKLAVEV